MLFRSRNRTSSMLFRSKLRPFIPFPPPALKPSFSSASAAAEEHLLDSSTYPVRGILTLAERGLGPLFLRSNRIRDGREARGAGKDGILMDRDVVSSIRVLDARISRLQTCHALAREVTLKEMKRVLRQMLDQEGGSTCFSCRHTGMDPPPPPPPPEVPLLPPAPAPPPAGFLDSCLWCLCCCGLFRSCCPPLFEPELPPS